MRIARRHGVVTLTKHADVTAHWNCRDRKLGPVLERSTPNHAAKADRETQDLDAYTARDPKMPKLVDRYQHADGHEINKCIEEKNGHVRYEFQNNFES
jgi:hypothetical protein